MGEAGKAISIVTKKEISYIKRYERDLNIVIIEKVIFRGKILDPTKKKPIIKKRTDLKLLIYYYLYINGHMYPNLENFIRGMPKNIMG